MLRAWRCLARPGGRNRLAHLCATSRHTAHLPFSGRSTLATSPCPAWSQPSPRVVHLVPRRISVGAQLGFVKGKKINGSAFHADSARLALLGWKKELGSHLGITLLFDLKLFARSHAIHPNPQTLADSAYLKRSVSSFKFSQHIKGPMIRYFSSYLKLKMSCWTKSCIKG